MVTIRAATLFSEALVGLRDYKSALQAAAVAVQMCTETEVPLGLLYSLLPLCKNFPPPDDDDASCLIPALMHPCSSYGPSAVFLCQVCDVVDILF